MRRLGILVVACVAFASPRDGYGTSCVLHAPSAGVYTVHADVDFGPSRRELEVDEVDLAVKIPK